MYYFPDKKADESASNSFNPSIVEGLVPLCAPDADCHGQSASGRILAERFISYTSFPFSNLVIKEVIGPGVSLSRDRA